MLYFLFPYALHLLALLMCIFLYDRRDDKTVKFINWLISERMPISHGLTVFPYIIYFIIL